MVSQAIRHWSASSEDRHRGAARKILVTLWRYLQEGVVPSGAVLVDWKGKLVHRKTKEITSAV